MQCTLYEYLKQHCLIWQHLYHLVYVFIVIVHAHVSIQPTYLSPSTPFPPFLVWHIINVNIALRHIIWSAQKVKITTTAKKKKNTHTYNSDNDNPFNHGYNLFRWCCFQWYHILFILCQTAKNKKHTRALSPQPQSTHAHKNGQLFYVNQFNNRKFKFSW